MSCCARPSKTEVQAADVRRSKLVEHADGLLASTASQALIATQYGRVACRGINQVEQVAWAGHHEGDEVIFTVRLPLAGSA